MKRIEEDIKSGKFSRVYLLYGKEPYLIRQYRNKLKKALVQEGDTMNVSFFRGKEVEVREIIDLAETLPFFADFRVIFVEDTGFFKREEDELAEYISRIPESTILIFVEEEVDKTRRLYKEVAKTGHAAEFGIQTEETLARWVIGRIRREKKNITRGAYELFISKTGTDMENIAGELEKLICYTMDKEVIEPEDVEAVTAEQLSGKVFVMFDAIIDHKQSAALDILADLMALKEPPVRILSLLTRQFQSMLVVKGLQNHGYSQKEIASRSGMPGWLARKQMRQCRNFSVEQMKEILEEGAGYEQAVKMGKMDARMAVELFIIACSGKNKP